MAADPVADGLARLQALRSSLSAETQLATEAAHSDRNRLASGDQYFAPSDLGFAVVDGTREDVPDSGDGVSFTIVVVDGAGRSGALDVLVPRAAAQTYGHDDPEAFVIERLRRRVGSIPNSQDRFALLLGLNPLDL